MRKLLGLAVLLTFSVGILSAQVRLNPKIGLNAYDVSAEDGNYQIDGKTGFHAGLDLRIGDKVYFQPGAHYYALRADFGEDGVIENLLTDDIALQTVRVPVLIGTSIINADAFALRAHVGGVGLFPLNVNDNSFLITKSDYKSVNFGAVVGAGLDLGKLTVDINYDFGLTDNFNEDAVIDFNGKGNVLSVSLGYLF